MIFNVSILWRFSTKTDNLLGMDNLENQYDEEPSLIDILSFCLRFRKLICFGTLGLTLLVGLWLYISPKLFRTGENLKDTFRVSYTIKSVNPPSCVLQEMSVKNVASIASTTIKDISFLSNQNKKYPVFGGDSKAGYEYNAVVKSAISDTKFNVTDVSLGTRFNVEMNVTQKEIDLFDDFVRDSVATVNTELEDYIFPIIENLNNIKDDKGNSKYPEVNIYKNSYSGFISIVDDPFVLKNSGRRKSTILIIAFVVSLFVTVLISFIINTVENIKKDEVISRKISTAWKAGK